MADGHSRLRWEDWVWDGTVFEGTAVNYRHLLRHPGGGQSFWNARMGWPL